MFGSYMSESEWRAMNLSVKGELSKIMIKGGCDFHEWSSEL